MYRLMLPPLLFRVERLSADGAGLDLQLDAVLVEVRDEVVDEAGVDRRAALNDDLVADLAPRPAVVLGEDLEMLPDVSPLLLGVALSCFVGDQPSLRVHHRLLGHRLPPWLGRTDSLPLLLGSNIDGVLGPEVK